jgi:hypothetical protein
MVCFVTKVNSENNLRNERVYVDFEVAQKLLQHRIFISESMLYNSNTQYSQLNQCYNQ